MDSFKGLGLFGFVRKVIDHVRAAVHNRNPAFYPAERKFLAANPHCFLGGGKSEVAHHIRPVSLYPELEMDQSNWRPVARRHHRPKCHGGNWRKHVRPAVLDRISRMVKDGVSLESPEITRLIEANAIDHRE